MILSRNLDWQGRAPAEVPRKNPAWIGSAAYLAELDERLARATASSGVLRDASLYHLATGGKRLRGRLTIAAGLALGLDRDEFLPLAAAVELLHGASLLHDDLQDGDRERRGCEAVWSRFGKDVALLLGDTWLAAAFAAGAEVRGDAVGPVVADLAACVASLAEGQGEDTAPPRIGAWTPETYESVARRKTGRLFALAFELPLLVAGVDEDERRSARQALEWLGVGYQIHDDLADLAGRKGRVPGSDLRGRRMSSALVHFVRLSGERGLAALAPTTELSSLADESLERRSACVLRSRALPACLLQQRDALRRSSAAAYRLGVDVSGIVKAIADELETASFRIFESVWLESAQADAPPARITTRNLLETNRELRSPA